MKRRAWIIAIIAFSAGVSLALAQNKVAPTIMYLIEELNISMATAGWLSSIFCLMGMIVAVPSAFLLNKLGVKVSGLLAIAAAIIGAIIGAFSTTVTMLMISRVIEGLGVGLIAVVGPAVISMWFPASRRGLPMGMWGSWQMVAQAVIFLVGGRITVVHGWQGVWWFVIAVCVFVGILYAWKVVSPPPEYNNADIEADDIPVKEGFKSGSTWLLALAGWLFTFSSFGFATWIAPYWSEAFKWDINYANDWVSRLFTIEIPMVIFMGWILDHIGNKRKLLSIISYAGYTVILFLAFRMKDSSLILLFVPLYALIEGTIPTAIWTLCAQTMKNPMLAGLAFGILGIGMNFGTIVGPPVTGAMIEYYGWGNAGIVLAVASLLGMVTMSFVKIYTPDERKFD